MFAIAIIIAFCLIAAGAVMIAIKRNGPAVLDTVDRIAGNGAGVSLVHRETFGPDPRQKLLVHRMAGAQGPLPVFVFIHGGSWANGDPENYGFIARNIAPEGFVVVLAGYRLGETGRYPAMLEDTAEVLAWVRDNIAAHGGDPARITVGGHSAGAYNAAQVVLEDRWLGPSPVRGVVGLAGPYDFYPYDSESTRATFGSVGAGADSQPVNHADGAAPPFLLVHGEEDTLVRPRNSHALAAALEERGARVETLFLPGKTHNDPLLALAYPWRRDALVFERVTAFLHEVSAVSVPVQAGNP